MTNKRNSTIDIIKVVFSLIIVIYHISINLNKFNFFSRGLLAVDFFFIVSGYLLVKSIKKSKESDSVYKDGGKFILKKYKVFFPYVLVGFIACLAYRIIIDKIKIHTILNSVFSLFLLQMSGLPMSKINNQTWYLSVMLISMFVLYPIIKKKEDKYLNYYCPIIVVMGFGLFNKIFSNFNNITDYNIVYNGMLRGFLEINLGCFIYSIVCKMKEVQLSKLSKIALTFLEILGYGFTVFMMNTDNAKMDMFIVLMLASSILISFSGASYLEKITSKLTFKNMDKLSLSIYCNHIAVLCVLKYLNKYMKLSVNRLALLILVSAIIFSSLVVIIVNKIEKIKAKRKTEPSNI